MKTKSDKAMEWVAEADYIARVSRDWPGPESANFNGERDCFNRYIRMQRESAIRDGFTTIATEIGEFLTGC